MAVQSSAGMPMDEFIRQYDKAPFELINGERIPLMPAVAGHGQIVSILTEALFLYEQTHPDIVIYLHMPIVVEDTPGWVKSARKPDLVIYRKDRLDEYKQHTLGWKAKPLLLIPDICVEVLSANEIVDSKVASYLQDGVDLVLVIDPAQKTVGIHIAGMNFSLSEADTLNGGEGLPGFSLPVRTLFA